MIDDITRKQLGAEGKLFSIEVLFDVKGEIKRYVLPNQTGDEIMKFRETVLLTGLYFPIDPGHGRLIFPEDLKEIDFWRQKKYWSSY